MQDGVPDMFLKTFSIRHEDKYITYERQCVSLECIQRFSPSVAPLQVLAQFPGPLERGTVGAWRRRPDAESLM